MLQLAVPANQLEASHGQVIIMIIMIIMVMMMVMMVKKVKVNMKMLITRLVLIIFFIHIDTFSLRTDTRLSWYCLHHHDCFHHDCLYHQDPEYDRALHRYFWTYHNLVDLMVRVAVNEVDLSSSSSASTSSLSSPLASSLSSSLSSS